MNVKILSAILPLDGSSPDYSGIPGYALPTLQQAFESGNYEIIPDPEPVPVLPEPGWTPFNFALFTDSDFVNYGKVANEVNPWFVPGLVERYGRIAIDGLQESNFPSYWQSFCLAFNVSAEHRNEWATLAESFNLPADFVSVIRS